MDRDWTHGPDNAVEAIGLKKTYAASGKAPPKTALHGVDLGVPRGSLFGLLGPNGAGKSTFINILAGLVVKTEGTATIWGHEIEGAPRAARRSIGVVPQELNIDPFFTPRELLDVQAGLYGVPPKIRKTEELLEIVGLADKSNAYARTLSGGMRRRLMVAKAMVHNPPVLVLDEPTAGVDVELRRQLWDQVRVLNQRGVTVMLTTHYLEEAEELCDRIAIINHGRLVACDRTPDLLARMDQKALTITVAEKLEAAPTGADELGVSLMTPDDAGRGRLCLKYKRDDGRVGRALALVQSAGLTIVDVSTDEPDLEEVFLALTSDSAAAA